MVIAAFFSVVRSELASAADDVRGVGREVERGRQVREGCGEPTHVQPPRSDPASDDADQIERRRGADHPLPDSGRRPKRCAQDDASQARDAGEEHQELRVPEGTVDEQPDEYPRILAPPLSSNEGCER